MNKFTPNNPPLSIPPGGIIGVMGGGQLGRMLAMAAARLGLKVHIYCPEETCPAHDVCFAKTIASYSDEKALGAFAKAVDVITYEFENVPADCVSFLSSVGAVVRPGVLALEKAQDRLVEKEFLNAIGVATAPFHPVDDLAALEAGLQKVGRPAILKTRRLGYDGKGQTTLRDVDTDLPDAFEKAIKFAWKEVGAAPSILEGFVPFEREISIIAARGADGDIQIYDPAENVHQNGILKSSTVPAKVSEETATHAMAIASSILEALDYVGVIGVEFFVLKSGNLIVNEFAPRVHNSGHWTFDACAVSQFEQHIRAVAGWPLGDPSRHSDAVMENLIGEEANAWRELAGQANTCVHLYGKHEARPGRKMGHVTRLAASQSNR